jgi:hypothetical protein
VFYPRPNNVPASEYYFRQLYQHHILCKLKKIYYCSLNDYVYSSDETNARNPCPNCRAPFSEAKYFYLGDIDEIVLSMLRKSDIGQELLRHVLESGNTGDAATRFFSRFPQFSKFGTIFWGCSTDGLCPYDSNTSVSIWPFFLTPLNLGQKKRSILSNNPLVGLWWGSMSDTNLCLKYLVAQFKRSFQTGLNVRYRGQAIRITSILHWMVGDLSAMTKLLDIRMFSGYYGCLFCHHPGVQVDGHVKYPTLSEEPLRTTNGVNENRRMNNAEYGLFLKSALEELPYWDVIDSWAIDGMHLLFLNVSKLLYKLWFGKKSAGEIFSLRRNMGFMTIFLRELNYPHDFGRPITSVDGKNSWKAEQWQYFIRNFALPVVFPYLPDEYIAHLRGFVEFMDLVISDHDPAMSATAKYQRAKVLIQRFVFDFPGLYGAAHANFCVHYLIHIPDDFRKFGYLSNHWMFRFESLGGHLLRLGKDVVNQLLPLLADKVSILANLSEIRSSIKEMPDSVVQLEESECFQLWEGSVIRSNSLLGKTTDLTALRPRISVNGVNALRSGKRAIYDSVEYHSLAWKSECQSSSMFVQYFDVAGGRWCYGRISEFIECEGDQFYARVTQLMLSAPKYRDLSRLQPSGNYILVNMIYIRTRLIVCMHFGEVYFVGSVHG